MKTVHAVFENGVFRPISPVDLPERTEVEFEPRLSANGADGEEPSGPMSEGLKRIYTILGERYESGYIDTAARHDEHQP